MSLGRIRQSTVVPVQSVTHVQIGQWVAVYCVDAEDPSVGKVEDINNDEVLVLWYKGKWNTQCVAASSNFWKKHKENPMEGLGS